MRFDRFCTLLLLAGLVLSAGSFDAARAAGTSDLDLVCSGDVYGKTGNPFPATETVSFKKQGDKPVMFSMPDSSKPAKANIVSSNLIQLKFSTDKFTAEYFNFSGDLFMIYKDGRFLRLACKPNKQ